MSDSQPDQPPPGLPAEERPLPAKPLWTLLLLPSAVTLFVSLLFLLSALPGNAHGPSGFELFLPFLGPVVALCCLPAFVKLMRTRYRGQSLVFLAFAYFLGQAILQFGLGYCCCLAIFAL